MKKLFPLFLSLLLALPLFVNPVYARAHNNNYAVGVKRDSSGHIARSSSERQQFLNQTGYPHGRKGYVVDHVIPLKRGGSDAPSNMQWQTIKDAKVKDKIE